MSFGAIGGAVIGGVLANRGSSSGQPSVQQTDPFSVSGGLFDTTFDKGKNLNISASGGLQDLQAQGIQNAGLFNQQALASPNALLAGQQGGQFLGGLQQDPFAVQQQLFDQQNQLLLPQQEQARLAQESRLFSQGRLGSVGSLSGQAEIESLGRTQNAQTQGLFNQSFGQAQQQQLQQANIGAQLSQLDPQIRGLFGNLGQQSLGNVLGIEQQGLNTAQVGGQLAQTSIGGKPPSQTALGSFGQGLFEGSVGQILPNTQDFFARSQESGIGSGGTFDFVNNERGFVGGL